jgi:hypothetical protein
MTPIRANIVGPPNVATKMDQGFHSSLPLRGGVLGVLITTDRRCTCGALSFRHGPN